MMPVARALTASAILALAACGQPEPPRETADTRPPTRVNETYPPDVAARLDSGNTAYSAGNFDEALRLYRAAAEAGPSIPSTWFGVYMAHHALGNLEAADSALARARELAPTTTPIPAAPPPPDTARS